MAAASPTSGAGPPVQVREERYKLRPSIKSGELFEVVISKGEGEAYTVPRLFHVAGFNSDRVAQILKAQKARPRKKDFYGRLVSRFHDLSYISGVAKRIFPLPLLFLVAYYFIQINYQLDTNLFCPELELSTLNTEIAQLTSTERCHRRFKETFEKWRKDYVWFTKLLTFLLGFYVSNITRRWWAKVENIPSVETSQLLLGAITANGKITKDKDDKDMGKDKDKDKKNITEDGKTANKENNMDDKAKEKDDKKNNNNCEEEQKEHDQDKETSNQLLTSHAAAIEAKKMIARYSLLSWTMCCSTFSQPLADEFGSARQLVAKQLLREREQQTLKVDQVAELWWLPLTWAINLVYKIGQSAEKEHAIIPKDSKSVIQQLVKLKTNLDNQKERNDNKFPHFYRKAIHFAVYVWLCMGVLGSQEPTHHTQTGWGPWITLLHNIPAVAIPMQIIFLGWMTMAEILDNPFGYNMEYDVDLAEELELNIWRCSVTLQHQAMLPNCLQMTREDSEALQEGLWKLIQPNSGTDILANTLGS